MTYSFTDISKPSASNPGTGGNVRNVIYFALQSWVDEDNFPARDDDLVTIHEDLAFLSEGWKELYATPESVDLKMNVVGEPDGKGFEITLEIFHPGRYAAFDGFLANVANENLYLKIRECSTGLRRIIGSPCSTAKVDTAESGYGKNVSERKGTTLVFKCTGPYPPAFLDEDSDSGA